MQKRTQHLIAQPITSETFQPYGQVIFATEDGAEFGPDNAQLKLNEGIPRFYIMRLHRIGHRFTRITRHLHCTQCLGSLAGKPWTMAVAPPGQASQPSLDTITAFYIPGDCFIKLEVGTWHAGPHFDTDFIDFYNLELSDTNQVDHDTCNLISQYNIEFMITAPV